MHVVEWLDHVDSPHSRKFENEAEARAFTVNLHMAGIHEVNSFEE